MSARRNTILIFAIIAFAVAFTSLTTLRFPNIPIGISELLILGCMVLHLPLSFGLHVRNGPRYFAGVVFLLVLATLPGYLITLTTNGTVDFALYNLVALTYVVIVVSYLHYGFDYRSVKFDHLLTFFIAFSMLYFIALFVLLGFDRDLVYSQDLEAWGDDVAVGVDALKTNRQNDIRTFRLVGFSKNPNQLALHALVVAIFCIVQWRRMGNMLALICLATSIAIGVLTQSDAFLISLIALLFVATIMGVVFGRSVILGLSVLLPGIVGLALAYKPMVTKFREVAEYGDQDATRYNLWINGIEAGMSRPLTGMGPGTWSGENGPFELVEAHNSLIDYFSMAGVPGTVLFVVVLLYLLVSCLKAGRSSLLAGFIAIALYATFHNILRHPIAWLAVYAIAHGTWVQLGAHQGVRGAKKKRRKRVQRSRGLEV